MAITTRQPLHGLLGAWQRRMGVNLWHFNQIDGPGVDAPVSTPGQFVYVQPEREQIAEALIAALGMGISHLGFYPRPVFLREPVTMRLASHWKIFQTRYKYVDALGKRGVSVIEADAPVVYSDSDGDTIDDLATITVTLPTGVTDPAEVQVFFTAADSQYPAADERWQIEPVRVTITGTTATITGHRALFANPALWRRAYDAPNYQAASKNTGTTTNVNDFVTEVDVYRVYLDTSDNSINAEIVDGMNGLVRLRGIDGCGCTGAAAPIETLYYRAGYPLNDVTGEPDAALELAFLRLANAEMPTKPVADEIRVNFFQGDANVYPDVQQTPRVVNNPLGIRVGQVEAWRTFQQYALNSVQPMGGFR